jgi:hypothetical protein
MEILISGKGFLGIRWEEGLVFGKVGFWAVFGEIAKEILSVIYIYRKLTVPCVTREITVEILE